MAIMRRKFHNSGEEGEGNIFWTTMADLLLGLAIIFMTLFVLAMTGFTQKSLEQKQNQIKASQELTEKLKKADIDAVVDSVTGDVKISDLELFDLGSYTLSENGKALLNKLTPIYINTIFSKEDLIGGIENIVVQGHTDSHTFAGVKTKEEQFIKNMDLSTKRANAVAEHMFKTPYDRKYSDRLTKMLIVEGKSFTEPVMVNDKEDYNKSRRVELRLKVKAIDVVQILFAGIQEQ